MPESSPEQILAKVQSLVQEGKTADAVAVLKRAVEKAPTSALYRTLGDVCFEKKQYEDAAIAFGESLAHDPTQADVQYSLGVCHMRLERPASALAAFEALVALRPENAKAWMMKGDALEHLDRDKEALAAYEEALKRDPEDAGVCIAVSLCHRKQGDIDTALRYGLKAVELEPDRGEYHYHLGRVYFDAEKLEDAVTSFARALDREAEHPGAHYWLGVSYVRMEEYEEAEPHLLKTIAHSPDFPGGHFHLGLAQEELGKLEEAQASYERVLELYPDDARTRFFLGCLHAAQSQTEEAMEQLERLESLDKELAGELDETIRFCAALDSLPDPGAIQLVERRMDGPINHEIFQAPSEKVARLFLTARRIAKPNYRATVITPEGIFHADIHGITQEKK